MTRPRSVTGSCHAMRRAPLGVGTLPAHRAGADVRASLQGAPVVGTEKVGQTFLAAVLSLWWAFTHARTEVIVCARISASYQRSALPLPTPPPRARRRGIIR